MAIDITSVLQEFQQRNQTPIFDDGVFRTGGNLSDPAQAIGKAINDQTLKLYSFPADLPPHHFTLIQGRASGLNTTGTGVGSYGNFSAAYKLPMPQRIEDTHSVRYDHSFNWLSLIASGAGLGGVAGLASKAFAGLGFAVNNFKAVTLSVPEFRTFQLEWRLFPKTLAESQAIQSLIIHLQMGMMPSKTTFAGYDLAFNFPDIFVLYFTTGPVAEDGAKYLFKFKPAVLQGIQVNYQGDNPVPAFYKNPEEDAIPEGVSIRTSWLELEFWTRENFVYAIDASGLYYNNDPFSAVNR